MAASTEVEAIAEPLAEWMLMAVHGRAAGIHDR